MGRFANPHPNLPPAGSFSKPLILFPPFPFFPVIVRAALAMQKAVLATPTGTPIGMQYPDTPWTTMEASTQIFAFGGSPQASF